MYFPNQYDEPELVDSPTMEEPSVYNTKKNNKKKPEVFLKFAKDILEELFEDDSNIEEINKDIYLVNIKKLDLYFKINMLDFDYFKSILLLLRDVYYTRNNNEKTIYIDRLMNGIESVYSANIIKHNSSEIISVVFIFQEPLVAGGTRKTRKLIITINPFNNVGYEYATKNNLSNLTIEEILVMHDKLLGKTFTDNIKDSFLVYSMIVESLTEHFEEKDLRVEFSFVTPSSSLKGRNYNAINSIFDYVGYYDAQLTTRVLDNYYQDDDDVEYEDDEPIEKEGVDFSGIFGLDTIKKELSLMGDSIKYKYSTKDKSIEIPKGILMIGAPGTGKTFITKAFAKQYDFDLMYLRSFVGNSGTVDSGAINRCFKSAQNLSKYNPTIVFIDEIDKIITRNNEQVMATLLESLSLDGDFLVIGACNYEDSLPKPLTRPGRFDKKFYFGDLTAESKSNIFKKMLDKAGLDRKDIDVESIVDYLPSNITVATLDAITKQAKIINFISKEVVDTIRIINIAESLLEGISETIRPNNPSMQRTAWHEAGHATLGLLLNRKITLATIKPSYKCLGYVLFKNKDDEIMIYDDYVRDIIINIGGWAAEKIIYKDLSVGATADFSHMQVLINFLTTYTGDSGIHLISTNSNLDINFSQNERNDMYQVKKHKTKKYIKQSIKLLKKHKILLKNVYDTLMLKERVTGEELERLYADYLSRSKKKFSK